MSNPGFMMDTRRLAKTALDVHGKLRIRIRPDLTQNDTWVGIIEDPRRAVDDDIGALYYVVAVIFIYGLSIVMMIASHIRKNKQDSQLRTYLKEMSNLRKTERREKVLHKMTDLAKREKEKAEREAESKRRLQEKLRLTGSGGESGDDTESDAPTSGTVDQSRQQRRPLLAARKPTFGSTSPVGSVAAIPIKDTDEDEAGDGGSDVPSGNESTEAPRTKTFQFVGEGKGDVGGSGGSGHSRTEGSFIGGKREMRLSPISYCYSSTSATTPPHRASGGSTTLFYTVPSDHLSPLSADTPLERTKFSFRARSTSFNESRRWRQPNVGGERQACPVGRGAAQSGQRSPGSSPSASITDFRLSPLCGGITRSAAIHEFRAASRGKATHKPSVSSGDATKSARKNNAKQPSKNKRPSSVTVDSKSTFPASFYIVDEDAVL